MDCQCFKTASLISVFLVLIIVSGIMHSPSAQADDERIINYQGQVDIGAAPYSEQGYIKFSIIDDPITPARNIWTNDGSRTGAGKEPDRAVALSLKSGQFTVALGDKRLGNMTAIDLSTNDDTETYLRVWFSVDAVHFEQLSPDNQLPDNLSTAKTEPLHAQSANAVTGISILSTTQLIDNTRETIGIIKAAALATSKIP